MDNYLRIITYKTAFYTFYLPVAAGEPAAKQLSTAA
jgi:geranylgeranyl pyrophosphate synthase